ncbi:tetratricopeptide repeat protein [Saccharothrix sp. ST-888]|uniref:tetratricopeptide repeat protein n=1 Tax=Saccharothrix sp. ST-888 TaxID=1427391 RepID=UPI000B07991D|nr:tetratricopeptide repeat protein [Saccharothrix sp. ST-888]
MAAKRPGGPQSTPTAAATPHVTLPGTAVPNAAFPNAVMRTLRGDRSPGEFATAIRRAAREIGEHVSCDARYVGRVESGEIRCPNYAYERVFRHMWPDRSLQDLGFAPRTAVRRRTVGAAAPRPPAPGANGLLLLTDSHHPHEENDDVRRRTFLSGGSTALAAALGLDRPAHAASPAPPTSPASAAVASVGARSLLDRGGSMSAGPTGVELTGAGPELAGHSHLGFPQSGLPRQVTQLPPPRRVGAAEVRGVEQAVRNIRLLDDAHGADTLFELAGQSLRNAYVLLNDGEYNADTERRLQSGAGELAISVGWLAHDSNRLADARSFYSEALATARMADDASLEAHVFCNSAFLARDAGRPREALRAAQAGQAAARRLDSDRLLSLLAMREAGGWAQLKDRAACERSLARAYTLFDRGESEADPEWMSFFGEAEIAGLEAQCWSALGEWDRASERAGRAIALQDPHFVRNRVLYTAELAHDRLGRGDLAGAANHGSAAVALLGEVRSARIRSMLADTAEHLRPHRSVAEVAEFLTAYRNAVAA